MEVASAVSAMILAAMRGPQPGSASRFGATADLFVDALFPVPAMWAALMTVTGLDSYDLSALEIAITGGAPCPLPVLEYFQGKGVLFQEAFS